MLIRQIRALLLALLPVVIAALILLSVDRHNRLSPAAANRGPLTAESNSPQKPKQVAVAYLVPEPGIEAVLRGLRRGLKELGVIEGVDLVLSEIHAQGEISQILTMGEALDSGPSDVILTLTTPVLQGVGLRVQRKPVVFTYVVDPLAAGAGVSFEHHAPKVTGIGSLPPTAAMMDLVTQVLPGARRLATLYNPAEANAVRVVGLLRDAARARGLTLLEFPLTSTQDAATATQALVSEHPDAVISAYDNTFYEVFETVSRLLEKAAIPLIIDQTDYLSRGALMAIGINFEESGRRAARPLMAVLRGESPAGIPFENVSEWSVAVNPTIAHQLGIRFPEALLKSLSSPQNRPSPATHPARISRLIYAESGPLDETLQGMNEGFSAAGLIEGQDYQLQDFSAQGDMSVLSTLADRVRDPETDLIIALSTPTLETLLRRGTETPIVFTFVANPMVAGAGTDPSHHLPQVTGVYTEGPYTEMVQLLQRHFPDFRRIGTLYAPNEDNSVHNLEVFRSALKTAGISLEPVPVNSPSELPDAALALAAKPLDAIVQILDNQSSAGFSSLGKAALRQGIPLFSFIEAGVRQGAALALTMDYHRAGYETAFKVAEVLRGRSPATIPFTRPSDVRLVLSPENAMRLHLALPQKLIEQADRVLPGTPR